MEAAGIFEATKSNHGSIPKPCGLVRRQCSMDPYQTKFQYFLGMQVGPGGVLVVIWIIFRSNSYLIGSACTGIKFHLLCGVRIEPVLEVRMFVLFPGLPWKGALSSISVPDMG